MGIAMGVATVSAGGVGEGGAAAVEQPRACPSEARFLLPQLVRRRVSPRGGGIGGGGGGGAMRSLPDAFDVALHHAWRRARDSYLAPRRGEEGA